MKKTFIYMAFAMAVASSTLTSCEDMFGGFLDKQPSNDLTEEDVFADWNMATQYHIDTYNYLLNGPNRVNNSWLDAATDLSESAISTSGVRTSFNIGNYYNGGGGAELTSPWEAYYRGIRKCNTTLEYLDEVPKNADLTQEQYLKDKMNYKSEARFLRAWFYWELFLRYGPVPIVTSRLDPDGDLLSDYTERPTIKEYVVDFILKELKDLESGLLSYEDYDSNKLTYGGRVIQPWARALYSRIMLYMASDRFSKDSGITWQQAADAAKRFIDDYGTYYSLVTEGTGGYSAYASAVLTTTYDQGNTEVIFFRNNGKIYWGDIQNDTPVGEGGNGGNCPSQNLVDMYDMKDGSSPFKEYDATGAPVYGTSLIPDINTVSGYNDATPWTNRDPRFAETVLYNGVQWNGRILNMVKGAADNPNGNANATPTGYYMRKYIPENILAANHVGNNYRNWAIIRYAEILLNYAEAMNEVSGPCPEVYNALNLIRHRAGITGNVEDRSDLTSSKERMRNFIRKERTVEFAFEEHRPWDVRRWNVAKEALSRPIYGIDVDAQGNITRKVAQTRVFEERMYLYPIPEGEYWKTGIENNPGW